MKPNPVLRELGFSDRDRVMIVHADDIGMCQAGVADYQAFTGDALRDFIKNSGVNVIGWRPLRELMRRKAGRG
jgi:hypothetical protein